MDDLKQSSRSTSTSKTPIFVSAKTADQIKNIKAFFEVDKVFQDAKKAIVLLLKEADIVGTEGLVDKLIESKKINPKQGVQIPYSLWLELSKQASAKHHSKFAHSNPISTDLDDYGIMSSVLSWFFTKIVVLPIPTFNLDKEFKDHNSFSVGLFIDFQGLPLYVLVRNKKFAGVLLSTQAFLASDEEGFWEQFQLPYTRRGLTYVYVLFFTLVPRHGTTLVTFCCPGFETFSSKELLRKNGREATRSLPGIEVLLTKNFKDKDVIKASLSALRVAIYLYSHLPGPMWLSIKKQLSLKKDSNTGAVIAIPPESPSIYILTKDGSFPLQDPNFSIEVKVED
ncbi:MAG: hypothetical protein LUC43_08890 [Burkholderiales bacterium]|nr:hypothetical protein [Burkholderiales bacterium]